MRKTLVTVFGGLITALGVILIVVPGPAWLLLPIGLGILSLEYAWAKHYLKKSQKMLSDSAAWMDNQVAKFKRN